MNFNELAFIPVPATANGSDNIPPPASSPTIKTEADNSESPFCFLLFSLYFSWGPFSILNKID